MPYKNKEDITRNKKGYYQKYKETIKKYRKVYDNKPEIKEKRKEYQKTYLKNRSEDAKKRTYLYTQMRHFKLKEIAILSKGGKCSKCGIEYNERNQCLFDFHHLNPKEKENDSWMKTKERMLKELPKLILVCSNCHRLIHWELCAPLNKISQEANKLKWQRKYDDILKMLKKKYDDEQIIYVCNSYSVVK